MDAGGYAMILFSACNTVRVLAYIPQIATIARDDEGAAAVSMTTWLLFALSNASTVAYASLAVNDATMALVFGANTLSCLLIAGLAMFKRHRYARVRCVSRA